MYTDAQLQLSTAQAVTAAAASTNYIDLGSARDLGLSQPLQLMITCNTAATAAGAATVQFQLQTDTTSAFGAPVTVIETDAIPKASLVAGYQVFIPMPIGMNGEFVRLYYNVASGPLTAGAFSAQIIGGAQSNKIYPSKTN